jgi:membrane associated rhomboid family serine protease
MRGSVDEGPYGGGGVRFAAPSMTPAVRALVVVNVVVFAVLFFLSLPIATRGWTEFVVRWFAIRPAAWQETFPLVPLWQLVTWGFLHSLTDPTHILFNMLGLYFLGTVLEGLIGSSRFLWTYFCGLVIAAIATLAMGLAIDPQTVTLGASGAVMCIVVATAVLQPRTQIVFIVFPMTLRTFAIIYVAIELFQFLLQMRVGLSHVAHLAHLTGAWWGFVVARRGWIWSDPLQSFRRQREGHAAERERSDQERLDELLEKIHHEGIHALSGREKAFLQRVSKRK